MLKRKFSALIPAFDPRPGRTNVNQTTDLEVPAPDVDDSAAASADPKTSPDRDLSVPHPKLQLTLRGPNIPGVNDIEVELNDPEKTVFHAVQQIIQASNIGTRAEKIRRVWEPTYVIVYREANMAAKDNSPGPLDSDDLTRSCHLPQLPLMSRLHCSMDEVLQLLRQMYIICTAEQETENSSVPFDSYQSKKITNKLVQQIQDSLVLSSNALPEWCHELTSSCPMLFPFETRLLYFQCTAFGTSRSIVWLQNQRDQNVERSRSGVSRGRDEVHEFRVGRIKHERVKVPRGEKLLEWAIQVTSLMMASNS